MYMYYTRPWRGGHYSQTMSYKRRLYDTGTDTQMVECGYDVIFAPDESGTVWGCGNLGLRRLASNAFSFTQLRGSDDRFAEEDVISVSAAYEHTAFVTRQGNLWTCGSGLNARIGHDDTLDTKYPTLVCKELYGGLPVIQVACGRAHTLVLTADKCMWGCGSTFDGQLGLGHTLLTNFMQKIMLPDNDTSVEIVMVAAGDAHSAATTAKGRLWTWGYNRYGQLGHEHNRDLFIPSLLSRNAIGMPDVMMVFAASYHTMAVNSEGQLLVWGSGCFGQLGLGNYDEIHTPRPVGKLAFGDSEILTVGCGNKHTLVVTTDGRLYTFGSGSDGKLGHGDLENSPVPVCVGAEHFFNNKIRCASAGCNMSAVVSEDGLLFTWGCLNSTGHLRDTLRPTVVFPSVMLGARFGSFYDLPETHALAIAMGVHVRLGADCKYLTLDDGIIRIIIELCVSRPDDRICKMPGLRRLLGGGLLLP